MTCWCKPSSSFAEPGQIRPHQRTFQGCESSRNEGSFVCPWRGHHPDAGQLGLHLSHNPSLQDELFNFLPQTSASCIIWSRQAFYAAVCWNVRHVGAQNPQREDSSFTPPERGQQCVALFLNGVINLWHGTLLKSHKHERLKKRVKHTLAAFICWSFKSPWSFDKDGN